MFNPWHCTVDTAPRIVQWRIDYFGYSSPAQTPVYLDMGNQNWSFRLEKISGNQLGATVPLPPGPPPTATLFIKHSPHFARDVGPHAIASFSIRVYTLTGGRKTFYHKEFMDHEMNSQQEYVWCFGVPMSGRSIVQVEFLQLEFPPASSNEGDKRRSCCYKDDQGHIRLNGNAALFGRRCFTEGILTDVTICASDGTTFGAHRAFLSAVSPVFDNLFITHNVKVPYDNIEDMPYITMKDMPSEALRVFLIYIYSGVIEDCSVHSLDLLIAADKYDMPNLRHACEEKLIEDVNTNNVLQRLQNAFMYRLPKLKARCIQYLVRFGKYLEIRDEFEEFIQSGDRELVTEVIREVISVWEEF